ncbi:hypothetical protein ElyMa_000911000 [Elysia marginata]|uniref:Uncharacterized protein n=1 Tax=Elysia marginata TaxID=1093978 RepID=A0AAV4HBL3_9GAST|nr:hypothetical protein ElyMa_000911000 [Elysia marginata]
MDHKTAPNLLCLQELLLLVAYFGVVKDSYAVQTLHFTRTHNKHILETGGCPRMYVDSDSACAMQCYVHTWCRVYVTGPCDQGLPNPCLCVICQMDPPIQTNVAGQQTVGTVSMSKRLVDQNSCGGGLQWLVSIHPACILATVNHESHLGSRVHQNDCSGQHAKLENFLHKLSVYPLPYTVFIHISSFFPPVLSHGKHSLYANRESHLGSRVHPNVSCGRTDHVLRQPCVSAHLLAERRDKVSQY